jgi:hypothetical protein
VAIPEFFVGTALDSILTSVELLHFIRSFLHLPVILQRFSIFFYACFLLVKNTHKISYNRNPVLKAIGIANAVKEQVNQNKENQRILAQATAKLNNWKSYRRNYMQP